MKVFANNHTIIGKFLRSLYVGSMTEYLWPFELSNDPCISRETELSKGFMHSPVELDARRRLVEGRLNYDAGWRCDLLPQDN